MRVSFYTSVPPVFPLITRTAFTSEFTRSQSGEGLYVLFLLADYSKRAEESPRRRVTRRVAQELEYLNAHFNNKVLLF